MSTPEAMNTTGNTGFDALIKAGRHRALWQPTSATRTVAYGRDAIMRLLQHRDPFLFLDTVTAIDLEQAAISGTRRIENNDPVFAGHFPGEPVYPGALLVESIGQLAGCLAYFCVHHTCEITPDTQPQRIRAFKIHHAVFPAEVLPGDELTLTTQIIDRNDFTMICTGQVMRGQTVCTFAILEAYLVGD